MKRDNEEIISIKLNTWIKISYTLPEVTDRLVIVIKKEDTEEFKAKLREIEEELATKKATDIVYSVSESYD
jgi:hypothetical protein